MKETLVAVSGAQPLLINNSLFLFWFLHFWPEQLLVVYRIPVSIVPQFCFTFHQFQLSAKVRRPCILNALIREKVRNFTLFEYSLHEVVNHFTEIIERHFCCVCTKSLARTVSGWVCVCDYVRRHRIIFNLVHPVLTASFIFYVLMNKNWRKTGFDTLIGRLTAIASKLHEWESSPDGTYAFKQTEFIQKQSKNLR